VRLTAQRVARLVALGLTDSQARAYLALLDLGPAGIGDVARATAIPRARLYAVFEEVHRLGLVDVLAEEPLRYAPRSLEGFLDRMVTALAEERENLERHVPELLHEFSLPAVPDGRPGRTRVLQGRRNALEHLAEAIEGARQRIVLACTAGTLRRFQIAGLDVALARRASEGVHVELLLADHARLPDALAALPEGHLVVHPQAAPLTMEILLADHRVAVAWTPSPDDGSLHGAEDEGFTSTSPAFCALYEATLAALGAGQVPVVRHETA
jgi:sugar-specific transcriptional regulator TrmB